ncbi:hypothetical protein OG21DRAFT_1523589 [Imleria badia]|nr:hypothetical protein OG21DRAFT_1523589 [Imleria badia]
MLERKPYAGLTRQLVLAFDIGTTYSGISYCILQPGEIPQPKSVMKFPGQGQLGDFKVPSVMYYDSKGNLKKVGYEATKDEVTEIAMTKGWDKVEWWKLHLRPKHLSSAHIKDDDIPSLPRGKSVVQVLTDFIEYLFRYIWQSVKDDIQFIFTHPNGWEEGEAGLHFCIWDLFASGVPDQAEYPEGQGVVVIDAGGGTIDLSMYSMKFETKSFEEIAPAECRLQGSVFVTRRAKGLLQKKLRGSRFSSSEMIDDITNTFDQTTKLHISNAEQLAYIKVGSPRENDPERDIRAGRLKLSGHEVTKLFDDSMSAVMNAFEQQRSYVTMPITMAFLIGGFGASDWFWLLLESYFKSQGIGLSRPSTVQKAVSDGALSFLVDHLVTSRVARATYGATFSTSVDEENPEHVSRKETWYTSATGLLVVPKAFQGILRKNLGSRDCVSCDIEAQSQIHSGSIVTKSFSTLCIVRFDLREAATALTPKRKLAGPFGIYYSLSVDVIISFGSTEFSAQVAWKVDGVEINYTLASTVLRLPGQSNRLLVVGSKSIGNAQYSVQDVQAVLAFQVQVAAQYSLKVHVKNTGPSRTRTRPWLLDDLDSESFLERNNFSSDFVYAGGQSAGLPAIIVSPGTQWYDAYQFASDNSVTIAGGVGANASVGAGGGWPMGAGHNILSPTLDLGADNVLEVSVVLPNATQVTANSYQNIDLFWALPGGGGPSFGIATSLTYKVYPQFPLYAAFFEATTDSSDAFVNLLNSFHSALPSLGQAGWSGYSPFHTGNYLTLMYLLPNGNTTISNATLGVWINEAVEISGVTIKTNASTLYPNYEAWLFANILDPVNVVGFNTMRARVSASARPLPRGFFLPMSSATPLPQTSSVKRCLIWAAASDNTLVVIFGEWQDGTSQSEIQAIPQNVTDAMAPVRALTPSNPAQYLNEPDLLVSDFTQANWGELPPPIVHQERD